MRRVEEHRDKYYGRRKLAVITSRFLYSYWCFFGDGEAGERRKNPHYYMKILEKKNLLSNNTRAVIYRILADCYGQRGINYERNRYFAKAQSLETLKGGAD